MRRAKRRSNATAVAVSVAAHAVVLTVLAFHAPKLVRPYEPAGPPEPVIPVLIMPRTPPAPPGATEPPRPIRLHRRQLRRGAEPPPVEPFVAPPEIATPRPQPRPSAPPRITVQPSPANRLTTTLRRSLVGCANPDLLTRAERERCLERLGGGAAEAPHIGPAASPALAADAARRDAARARRDAPLSPGLADPFADSGASNRNRPLYDPVPPPLRP